MGERAPLSRCGSLRRRDCLHTASVGGGGAEAGESARDPTGGADDVLRCCRGWGLVFALRCFLSASWKPGQPGDSLGLNLLSSAGLLGCSLETPGAAWRRLADVSSQETLGFQPFSVISGRPTKKVLF